MSFILSVSRKGLPFEAYRGQRKKRKQTFSNLSVILKIVATLPFLLTLKTISPYQQLLLPSRPIHRTIFHMDLPQRGVNLFVSSFVSFSINGLKENAENLNYYPILKRKVELYLFLSTHRE